MGPTRNVSALVAEMQETLAKIHTTLTSVDPEIHEAKLDELEKRRNDAIKALSAAFLAESDSLSRERASKREEVAEKRKREDEERERRRREEDEEFAASVRKEDQVRDWKFKSEREKVEQEMEELMSRAEEEARLAVEQGREKLQALQEKRRVSSRLTEKTGAQS
ncbi:hypothetical protein C7999DRAFT_15958 [Corynascus novoguineensis]|uniref:Uncharacterized protein n=1 Tax=Corynascus novoguineensis TaxID=1126955 RepID=A0AAN7CPB6_9PEZI|nr:hypothetical protein C7999DRAFT_15958 [Corynascus novoguineensis]